MTRSVPPPGGVGTIISIGRVGYLSCAITDPARTMPAHSRAVRNAPRRLSNDRMSVILCLLKARLRLARRAIFSVERIFGQKLLLERLSFIEADQRVQILERNGQIGSFDDFITAK